MQRADEVTAVAYMAWGKDQMRAAQVEALRKSRQFPEKIRMLIDAFSERHELPDLLNKYGYVRQGIRWRSPMQHGQAALCILDDGMRWVTFSESDLAAGIGTQSANGDTAFGDAFALYLYFEHGGNFRAALRALGHKMGE